MLENILVQNLKKSLERILQLDSLYMSYYILDVAQVYINYCPTHWQTYFTEEQLSIKNKVLLLSTW